MAIVLQGGPHDGMTVDNAEAEGCVMINAEHFTFAGVDMASYRINPDRTRADFVELRSVYRP